MTEGGYGVCGTLDGVLLCRLGRMAEGHERPEREFDGYHFKGMRAGNKMSESVLVAPASQPEESGAEGPRTAEET